MSIISIWRKVLIILLLLIGTACISYFNAVYVDVVYEPEPLFRFHRILSSKPITLDWIMIVDPETDEIIWDIRGKPQVMDHLTLGTVPVGFCEVIPIKSSFLKEGKEFAVILPNFSGGRRGKIFTLRGRYDKK